ncbi:uncharacterized protein [Ptychodera flava]|uniref:uncharacterized protein n=1 Tax=Ptychodera flava TaxID=63121 RepID=UPI00396A29EE
MHDFQSVLDLSPNVWTYCDCTSRKVIIPQDLPEKLFVLPVCKSAIRQPLTDKKIKKKPPLVSSSFSRQQLTKCQQTNVQDCGVYCLYFMNTVLKYFRRRSCI